MTVNENNSHNRRITHRQLEVLALIHRFTLEHGIPPSCKDIADERGWSSANAAYETVKSLTKKGLLSKKTGLSRSIVLTAEGLSLIDGKNTAIDLSNVSQEEKSFISRFLGMESDKQSILMNQMDVMSA